MKNLDRSICLLMKEARRGLGISQSELAAEVGCKQSALSMFEQGDPTKLNDEVVEKLSRRLNVDLAPREKENPAAILQGGGAAGGEFGVGRDRVARISAFCPNPACPGNEEYFVEGRRFLRPVPEKCDPAGGRFCALCGEILERKCPNCGALLHPGAVCTFCGERYIAVE